MNGILFTFLGAIVFIGVMSFIFALEIDSKDTDKSGSPISFDGRY